MKSLKNKIQYSIILVTLILLSFTTGDSKSEYILPLKAYSVFPSDIDLDGDNDLILGHKRSWQATTPSISILMNDGHGNFVIEDTSKSYCGYQNNIFAIKANNDEYPDIVTFYTDFSSGDAERFIRVWYNEQGSFNSYSDFNLNQSETISKINYGDINGDSFIDIVVASNGSQFWGVLFNDGSGNFSEPEYHNSDLHPNDIEVGDIDGNGRDDIAIAGTNTEIYYSFESGFEKFTFSGYERDVALNDLDQDGDLDVISIWGIAVTNYIVYENLGYQNFLPHNVYIFEGNSGGLRISDINNDGLLDITFAGGGNYKFLINNGELIFSGPEVIEAPNFIYPVTYQWKDLDNNYSPDLIIVKDIGVYEPNLKLLFNEGNGNFGENPITNTQTSILEPQTPNLSCFPNPFKENLNIQFNVHEDSFTEISVYDLSGNLIYNLCSEKLDKGNHKFTWKGMDNKGIEASNGTYLIVLNTDNYSETKQIVKISH